jgi:hypothetical protein
MTHTMPGWRHPLHVRWQRVCGGTWPPPMDTPSSALPDDPTGRTMTPTMFTLVSPVPTPLQLAVELVPASCWCSTVRDHVSREQGDQVWRETSRYAQNAAKSVADRDLSGRWNATQSGMPTTWRWCD